MTRLNLLLLFLGFIIICLILAKIIIYLGKNYNRVWGVLGGFSPTDAITGGKESRVIGNYDSDVTEVTESLYREIISESINIKEFCKHLRKVLISRPTLTDKSDSMQYPELYELLHNAVNRFKSADNNVSKFDLELNTRLLIDLRHVNSYNSKQKKAIAKTIGNETNVSLDETKNILSKLRILPMYDIKASETLNNNLKILSAYYHKLDLNSKKPKAKFDTFMHRTLIMILHKDRVKASSEINLHNINLMKMFVKDPYVTSLNIARFKKDIAEIEKTVAYNQVASIAGVNKRNIVDDVLIDNLRKQRDDEQERRRHAEALLKQKEADEKATKPVKPNRKQETESLKRWAEHFKPKVNKNKTI